MRIAYFDCIGGISGDMALGAVLDAGATPAFLEKLVAGLRTMALPSWELQTGRTQKHGIDAATVEVIVRGQAAGAAWTTRVPPADAPLTGGHTHSHEHSHASAHTHSHEHTHESHAHSHASSHTHTHEASEEHGTSTFAQVEAVIRGSGLPDAVKEQSVAVYAALARAEAAVHGATLETVHFHEVGAVDSIVDVVGTVFGLHLLGVQRMVCSPLPNGHGFVRCAHGLMPVPPPATAELLKGCPIRPVDVQGELVTPTGAALARTLAAEWGTLPAVSVESVGYGAGSKDFPFPNLMRLFIGELTDLPTEARQVLLIEANIDDQSPQLFGSAMEALFAAGALDVWLTPILMKKGRPAHTMSVLCAPEARERLERVIFSETTTLGVRSTRWDRSCLQREWIEVDTPWGNVRVKVGRHEGSVRTATPEYEDCRRVAREGSAPVKQVQAAAAAAAWQHLREGEAGS